MEQILARLRDVCYVYSDSELLLRSADHEETLFMGPVEELRACLDGEGIPIAVFCSGGRLFFVRQGEEVLAMTPPARQGCRWAQPYLCAGGGVSVCACMQEGDHASLFLFSRSQDGSFRGRRLMSAVKGLALHALLEEGPGVRLYFSRRDRQPFRVLSLDVCSDRLMERMEFGLPQDGRDLSFVRFAERTHCAYVAGGALFVDGILLCACPDDARPELESQGGELMCRLSSPDGVRSFVFRDQGWSVMKGENVQRNIPADLPSPVPVSPVPSVPETESFREILHNQAMLLRTLREKQELLERKTFAMEARLQAQSAQSEQLRRRTEGLQAALEALERLGLRPQG